MNQEQALAVLQAIAKASREGFIYNFGIDRDRARHAAATMAAVDSLSRGFHMGRWFSNQCGTTACIMGHIALTPEWYAAGGATDVNDNCVSFNHEIGEQAAKQWFGGPDDDATMIVMPHGAEFTLKELIHFLTPHLVDVCSQDEALFSSNNGRVAVSPWFHGLDLRDNLSFTPEIAHVCSTFNAIADTGSARVYIRADRFSYAYQYGFLHDLRDMADLTIPEMDNMFFGEQK